MKSLKARPELDRLYKKLVNGAEGLTFSAFEQFMQTSQKVGVPILQDATSLNMVAVFTQQNRT